jgi:hypothetical protein
VGEKEKKRKKKKLCAVEKTNQRERCGGEREEENVGEKEKKRKKKLCAAEKTNQRKRKRKWEREKKRKKKIVCFGEDEPEIERKNDNIRIKVDEL